ncbi:MAG: 4Fe-4S binding protein [Nitrospiraceae bacterium]|nr:4Fe-4S binding protein [Nitrospiraceae bacterium]
MLEKHSKKRTKLQSLTWVGLPLIVIGGWFYPILGYFLIGCMIGGIGIAFYKGRAWCDWMCPRGSFYDLLIKKTSRGTKIPKFLKDMRLRIAVLVTLITVLGAQIYSAYPDIKEMGLAMVKVLSITTIIGITIGIFYHQRAWCYICPVGTISNSVSDGKNLLNVKSSCIDCKICSKVCPMQIKPYKYKNQGIMENNDCIKCSTCVAACPKRSLEFRDEIKKAA